MPNDENIIESGRNDKGQFVSKQQIQAAAQRLVQKANVDTERATKSLDQLKGAYAALRKQSQSAMTVQSRGWERAQKQFAKTFKQQAKTAQRFYKSIEKMRRQDQRQQVRAFRQQLRSAVAGRGRGGARVRGGIGGFFGGGRGGMGFGIGGGLAPILGIGAVYAIARKFMSASTPLLNAEINRRGAVADIRQAVRGTNVAPSKAAELVTRYQGLGKAQFFGGAQATKGLVRLQAELSKGMGVEAATQLVEDLAKSYGEATDRLNAFLEAAGTGDIKRVLEQFATGENIIETTKAINALGIATDASKGKLDPLVEANLRITQTMDSLNQKVEQLITDLTEKLLPAIVAITDALRGMDASTLALLAGGALVAPTLLRGGASLLARGVGMGAGGAGAAGAGGLLFNPVTGAIAVGTAGALAIDKYRDKEGVGALGWYLRAREAQSRQVDQSKQAEQQALQRQTSATTELDRLRAQRDAIRAKIGQIPNAFGGGYSEENRDELKRLQVQYENVGRKIRDIQKTTQQGQPKQKTFWDTVKDGAKTAVSWLDKVNKALQQSRIEQLKEQARRQQQAKLNADVAASSTDLKRAELEYARLNPFGPEFGMMQSIPEFRALQDTIRQETDRLTKYLETIDASTEQGAIEANKTRKQIIDLKTESKRLNLELLQGLTGGYLDAIGAQALGAGKFEKFIVTQERNLGKGMRAGMVKENPRLGTIVPKEAFSRPFQFGTDMDNNVQEMNDWSKRIEGRFRDFYPQLPKFDMPMPKNMQDAIGGSMQRPEIEPQGTGDKGNGGINPRNPGWRAADKMVEAGNLMIEAGKEIKSDSQPQRPYRSGRWSAPSF